MTLRIDHEINSRIAHRLFPGEGVIPLREIVAALKGYPIMTDPVSIEMFRPEYWSSSSRRGCPEGHRSHPEVRMNSTFDIAFLGHYTKDTIVSAQGTRVVDGGAFNYGSHAAIRMGLKVAAITRLAKEDFHVIDELKALGVHVSAKATPHSTCLRLEYPSSNPDERIIYITSSAGPFTPSEVVGISAKAFVIGASVRGEVPVEVIRELRKKRDSHLCGSSGIYSRRSRRQAEL